MSVGGIADPLEHHHALLLSVVVEVLAEVPGRREHLFLDDPCDQLPADVGLLRAELVRRVGDLVRVGNVADSHPLEHLLPELSRLVLADLLRRDQLPKLLVLVVVRQRTSLVAVHLHVDLLDHLLEDLVVQIGEETVQLRESYPLLILLVFLKEADDIGLGTSLDKVVILPRLRVVNLHVGLRLDLAHQVHVSEFADVDGGVAVFVLVGDAEEVVPGGPVVEHGAVVHVVLQHSEPAVLLRVDLTQQRRPLLLLLKHLHTVGANVR